MKKTCLILLVSGLLGLQTSDVFAIDSMGNTQDITQPNQDAKTVIDKYIKAVGGFDKVSSVKNITMSMEVEMQGMLLQMKGTSDSENIRFVQETSMMGNVVQKTVLANGKGKVTAMGQEQELDENTVQSMKAQAYAFPEIHYADLGYELSLRGVEKVEGEDANMLIITTPNGMQTVEYYSVASGLKLKTSSEMAGDIVYSDYEEVDGLKFPKKLTISNPMMPMALEAKVVSIVLNQNLDGAVFEF
jgi:hypothetical protein